MSNLRNLICMGTLTWLKYLRRILSFYMQQRLEILLFDVGKMGPRSFKNFAVNYKLEKNERSNRIVPIDFNLQPSIAFFLSCWLTYFFKFSEKKKKKFLTLTDNEGGHKRFIIRCTCHRKGWSNRENSICASNSFHIASWSRVLVQSACWTTRWLKKYTCIYEFFISYQITSITISKDAMVRKLSHISKIYTFLEGSRRGIYMQHTVYRTPYKPLDLNP